jgi:hypothetical protein
MRRQILLAGATEPNRIRVLESTTDGKLEITGGRFVNGGEFPAANKCAATSR